MRWRNRNWLVSRLQEAVRTGQPPVEHPGLSPGDAETLANWADAARERGPVLFVGAGWTRNAIPAPRLHMESDGPPVALLWTELARKLGEPLSREIENLTSDPLWLAELYRQRHGEDALLTIVREAVPDDLLQPGPLFEALRSISWRALLTTNYDTLLERTFVPFQRVRVCVDDVDLVRSASRDAVELIHLHGVISRPKTIVLAFEDYRRYPDEHFSASE
jgi:hypothetical protein